MGCTKKYKFCIVPQCTSSNVSATTKKLLIRVSLNPESRRKWFELAGKIDAGYKDVFFCEDHFDLPNDMINYMQYCVNGSVSKIMMKTGCMPSKFDCQSKQKDLEKDETRSSSTNIVTLKYEMDSQGNTIHSLSNQLLHTDIQNPEEVLPTSTELSINTFVYDSIAKYFKTEPCFEIVKTEENTNGTSQGCIAPRCPNIKGSTPKKLYIRVPTKPKLRKKWLQLAGCEHTHEIFSKTRIYFCEDHFDLPNDMLNYETYRKDGCVKQILMKCGSMPTKFECTINQKDIRNIQPSQTEVPNVQYGQRETRSIQLSRQEILNIQSSHRNIRNIQSDQGDVIEVKVEDPLSSANVLENMSNCDDINHSSSSESDLSNDENMQTRILLELPRILIPDHHGRGSPYCRELDDDGSMLNTLCAVPQCSNSEVTTPDKLFIAVPSKRRVRQTWLELAECDTEEISRESIIYFCEDHFDLQNDMINYMQYYIDGFVDTIRMRPGYLPCRFDCQSGTKRTASPCTSDVNKRKRDNEQDPLSPVSDLASLGSSPDDSNSSSETDEHSAEENIVKQTIFYRSTGTQTNELWKKSSKAKTKSKNANIERQSLVTTEHTSRRCSTDYDNSSLKIEMMDIQEEGYSYFLVK